MLLCLLDNILNLELISAVKICMISSTIPIERHFFQSIGLFISVFVAIRKRNQGDAANDSAPNTVPAILSVEVSQILDLFCQWCKSES